LHFCHEKSQFDTLATTPARKLPFNVPNAPHSCRTFATPQRRAKFTESTRSGRSFSTLVSPVMILEYSDVLHTLAQIAVTLAGFIGLILVFQRGDRSAWSKRDKNTMFHLLYTSLGVLGLSLFPLLLQPAFSESVSVWRICSPLVGVTHAAGATRALLENLRGEITIPIRAVYVLATGSYLLMGVTILIAAGYMLNFAPLVYFIGLGWLLSVSVLSFVSLVFGDAA
jgi:hypothetical protein